MSLSVVMPVYNEARTVARAVREVLAVEYPAPMELIVVDDGSDDGTSLELALISDRRVRVHRHPTNLGKGAAVRTGFTLATGTHVLPFDADLEYSPEDVPRMLAPIQAGRCDVVYGTRLFGVNTVYQSYRYAMGNRITTLAANVLFDSYIRDLHTCLKLLPRDLVLELPLRETGFGLDTEITASLLRLGVRPFEVPVSYHSRTHAEGKKLSWRDGVECLQILGRVRFARRRGRRAGVPAARPVRVGEAPGAGARVGDAAPGRG
ncbi:glycosyltransferase family 2 protein [Miltoncostaea marina]|uniref:glycosyltransferase family 2 protein n=1 Tax=Miltoncostaea marina TaxID=2843215 RepID=UPI001C3CF9F0|nr:glycosyltransferase family 2 protein [Miltoncostaea marina]